MHAPSSTRVALRFLTKQAVASPLDGMSKRKALTLVNRAIEKAHTNGFFDDQHWAPIQRIWDSLNHEGIPFGITKSEYEHEVINGNRVPVRKVWRFEVTFMNERQQKATLYGVVTAAGSGSVDEPLAKYDVTAYAN